MTSFDFSVPVGPKLGSANLPELRGAAWPMMLGQMGAPLKSLHCNCNNCNNNCANQHI
jgi:hypothetical protein